MSSVKELAEDLVMAAEMMKDEERKGVRFTIGLDYKDNRRFEYICKELGQSKAGLGSAILCAALHDFETELGLTADPEGYSKYITKMYSNEPLSKVSVK